MSDITYDQVPSTFYGLIFDSYPADDANKFKALCGTVYKKLLPEPSYSFIINNLASEFDKSIILENKPWLTSELEYFLSKSSNISLESLEYFMDEIYAFFGHVNIETVIHTDPEEGWTKPVFVVHSGIDDLDELMRREDKFFEKVDGDYKLISVLSSVIVSQA